MKTYVLYNKKAGNGTGGARAEKLRALWKDKELIYKEMNEIDGYAQFFASIDESDEVVLCGGDGTLNRFINDTEDVEYKNNIFYFAVGSGNDFWHDLGGKPESEPRVINEYLKDLPVVEVKGKAYRFINGIGYGIDGYCCEVGDKLREKENDKPINYTSIAIKGLLFEYKPTNAVVTVDGKEFTFDKVWLAPTMNGRFYGGGMMPAPDQDRLNKERTVSVMVMHGAGKVKTLAAFPTIFKGEHVKKEKMVKVIKGNHIHVQFDRPVALQIDGETILDVTEYTVRTHS